MSGKEHKLWIVVSKEGIDSKPDIITAVAEFDNLATFVVSGSKIVCLTYNPEGKPQPEEGESPIWSIEEVPLNDIAQKMLEKMKEEAG